MIFPQANLPPASPVYKDRGEFPIPKSFSFSWKTKPRSTIDSGPFKDAFKSNERLATPS